jgi:hypothetical protein
MITPPPHPFCRKYAPLGKVIVESATWRQYLIRGNLEVPHLGVFKIYFKSLNNWSRDWDIPSIKFSNIKN